MRGVKAILLHTKTYAFASQNLSFYVLKAILLQHKSIDFTK
ncbi:hypothetical protein HMPREF9151_01175 [Hoylesella saccharolytica F0055]|uniref:Uncharacterized protein n=1 Tax=Hoylesella saccharolytica F0055 TaxID=1127699 RepID=L1NBR0_9BACT|nr:hypothetical protein HMPREF9151_01175 [Hoylesella saccharolytica F0055]